MLPMSAASSQRRASLIKQPCSLSGACASSSPHRYTIEVEIHDGPYNVIKNWDYVGLIQAMQNGQGKLFATRVSVHALQPGQPCCFQHGLPLLLCPRTTNSAHCELAETFDLA